MVGTNLKVIPNLETKPKPKNDGEVAESDTGAKLEAEPKPEIKGRRQSHN